MAFKDPMMNEQNEIKAKTMKFSKVGDGFKGTLVHKKTIEVNREGEGKVPATIYEFKAHAGEFHETEMDSDGNTKVKEPAIKIESDEYLKVWGRKDIDENMRRASIGDIVAITFSESKPSKKKGFRPTKILKIYLGGQDPNYMGEGAGDEVVDTEQALNEPEF